MSKLLLIIFLAALVRFVGLSVLPPALNRDEAALGYNAYSILKTAKDEHGQFLPLAFKSIGDYKMPLYIYATVIPVKLFGLNDFSIRFWSALSGVISVIAIYFISKLLFTNYLLPITAGFLLTLNPWAIFYSRIAYEANLALALFLVGLWLIINKKFWGLIFWLLACLAYSSALIFIPLFFIFFYWRYRPKIIPSILFIVLFSLIFVGLWRVSSQKQNITVFSDPTIIDNYHNQRSARFAQNPLTARLFWNKYVYFGRLVAKNYLATFSPRFLIIKGDNHPWHQIPGMGNFYYVEVFLALIGLLALIKTKNKQCWLLFGWLLLAPLASAVTIDAPHSTRSLFLLPLVILLAGFGFGKIKRSIWWLVGLIYFINLIFAGRQYLQVYPKAMSSTLPVGLKQAIQSLEFKDLESPVYLFGIHDSIYLYPLVYTQFDPRTFQQMAVWTQPDTVGLINAYRFGQFVVVDDQSDIQSPAAVILPTDLGKYQVFHD